MALPPAAVGKPRAEADLKFMQKLAQVAEESGSRVWARPTRRAAYHLTPFALARTSHWRQSVFGMPKQTTIITSKVPRL